MMGDLIDRKALCAKLQKRLGSPEGHRRLMEVNQCICEAPAIDAVPVVRCVDCIACFNTVTDPREQYNGGRWWYCAEWDMEFRASTVDPRKYFCADGERREEEDGNEMPVWE